MDPDGANVRRVFKKKAKGARSSPAMVYGWQTICLQIHGLGSFRVRSLSRNFWRGRCRTSTLWGIHRSGPPDGSEIAYSIPHQFGSRLTFINVRTRKLEQPLPDKALQWQSNPSWSAARDRLAISGNKHLLPVILDRDLHNAWADKYTVFIVNRDGTGLQQLLEEDGPRAGVSALSPDGSEVIYTQEINGHSQIFKIDINTGVRTQLTHIAGPFRQTNSGGDWFDPTYALPVSPKPTLLTTTWGEQKKK